MHALFILAAACAVSAKPVYKWGSIPYQTQGDNGQTGYNNCTTIDSPNAKCQTLLANSIHDFCLWGGNDPNDVVGEHEAELITWCLKAKHGARLMPPGTIQAAYMIRTPHYIQISGRAIFSKINIDASDETGDGGGELDPHGPEDIGNPIGGLVFSTAFAGSPALMSREWNVFLENDRFCIRACRPTVDNQSAWCPHIYDVMGCKFNAPGNYIKGYFQSCKADDGLPPGLYPPSGVTTANGDFTGWSTFRQGQPQTPEPHAAPKSSQCTTYGRPTYATYPSAAAKASTTLR